MMRLRFAVASSAAALAAAAAAPAGAATPARVPAFKNSKIVLGKSIGGVARGMTKAKVRAAIGRPSATSSDTQYWTSKYGTLTVGFTRGIVYSVVIESTQENGSPVTVIRRNPFLKLKTPNGVGLRTSLASAQAKFPGGVLRDRSSPPPRQRTEKQYLVRFGAPLPSGAIVATFFGVRSRSPTNSINWLGISEYPADIFTPST